MNWGITPATVRHTGHSPCVRTATHGARTPSFAAGAVDETARPVDLARVGLLAVVVQARLAHLSGMGAGAARDALGLATAVSGVDANHSDHVLGEGRLGLRALGTPTLDALVAEDSTVTAERTPMGALAVGVGAREALPLARGALAERLAAVASDAVLALAGPTHPVDQAALPHHLALARPRAVGVGGLGALRDEHAGGNLSPRLERAGVVAARPGKLALHLRGACLVGRLDERGVRGRASGKQGNEDEHVTHEDLRGGGRIIPQPRATVIAQGGA